MIEMRNEKEDTDQRRILIINSQFHFIKKNGTVYAKSLMDSLFWNKYLSVFDELYVLARMKQYKDEDLSSWIVSSCERVHFIALPDFVGPMGYVKNYIQVGAIMKKCLQEHKISCALIRSPDPIGYRFLNMWRKTGKPYGMEIVANYTDDFYYSIDMPHSIIYGYMNQQTKRFARQADGVSYVTKEVLQKAYPATGITVNYSSIDLPKELYFLRTPLKEKKKQITLIHVSTLELDVKGNEEFLQVQKRLINEGYDLYSVIVGGGRLLEYYKTRVKKLGLDGRVRFTGHLSKKEDLMHELRSSDIFLFPTLSEGLPRTVIEAMASSLPCVSSDIPSLCELIDEEWLCDAHDVRGLAERVKRLINDVDTYNAVSRRNFEAAQEYEYENLSTKRKNFYEQLVKKRNQRGKRNGIDIKSNKKTVARIALFADALWRKH